MWPYITPRQCEAILACAQDWANAARASRNERAVEARSELEALLESLTS